MNLKIKKTAIPFFVLFFPIIIDSINGYLRGSEGSEESIIGILYRGIIVVFSLLYLFRTVMSKYIILVFTSIFISLAYHFLVGYFTLSEISPLIKVLYIYSVLSILLGNKQCCNIRYVANCAIGYGLVAAVILIYSFVFKVGYSSYVEDTFGTKGFFIAMNDVGLTILLLNVLACFFYLKTKEIKYLISILIMSAGSALVGSMASYFGTAIILGCFVLNVIFFKYDDYKSSKSFKVATIIAVLVILNVAVWRIIDIIIDDPYLSGKYSDIFKTISEMSGRDYLIDASLKVLGNYSFFDLLFGTGSNYMVQIQNVLHLPYPKSSEVDPLDLVGVYGLIFSTFLIIFPLFILFKSIRNFFTQKDLLSYWLIVGISLYIFHSIYGGHAYTSPLVSSYLAVLIYLYIKRKELYNL